LIKSLIANNPKLMVIRGTNSKLTELSTKQLEESLDTSKTTVPFYFLMNDLYQMTFKYQNGLMIAKSFIASLTISKQTYKRFSKETNKNSIRNLRKQNFHLIGWQDRMLLVLGWE
jgi:hypothetical protein